MFVTFVDWMDPKQEAPSESCVVEEVLPPTPECLPMQSIQQVLA